MPQELADGRLYGGERSDASRIAGWGKAGLIRDLGPLVAPRTGAEAQRVFAARSTHVDALDDGEAEAEAVGAAIAGLRRSALEDLQGRTEPRRGSCRPPLPCAPQTRSDTTKPASLRASSESLPNRRAITPSSGSCRCPRRAWPRRS